MKKITLSVVAGALIATSGAALAQSQEVRRGPAAEVTRDQAIARAEQRFSRLDANSDGQVTAQEAQQVRQNRRAARQGQVFDRLDANRDGSLSREEFGQRLAMRAERREARGVRRGGMRGPARAERRAGRLVGQDGAITREEFRNRAIQRFERLDANRDGTVTMAERRETRQRMRAERQNRRRGAQQN